MENKSMDDILQEIASMDQMLEKANRLLNVSEKESLITAGIGAMLLGAPGTLVAPYLPTFYSPTFDPTIWVVRKVVEKIKAEKMRRARDAANAVLKDYYQALAVKQTQLAKKREEELRILRDLKMQDDKKREELEGKIEELESILCAIEKKLA